VSQLGGLDILVNNAGVTSPGNVESFPLQEFDRMLAVNVRAVFVAIQHAIPHLGTDARIITTGSIFADHTLRPGSAVYAMTKAAVAGLTRGLARELGPCGITLNVIQPGPIATDANPDTGEFADAIQERPRWVTRVARRTSPAPWLIWHVQKPDSSPESAGMSTAASPPDTCRCG
jgi:3-oxoacyl-[acyl-carrier protein] reductase